MAGVTLVGRVLDVSFERAGEQLASALTAGPEGRPEFVLHLGVAVGSERVRIEEQAVNTRISPSGDVDGACFEATAIDDALQPSHVRCSAVAAGPIVDRLNDRGLPARRSTDAGRYVCNCLYFRSLQMLEDQGVPCLFCHLPEPAAVRSSTSSEAPAWTRDRLLEAALRVAEMLAGASGARGRS